MFGRGKKDKSATNGDAPETESASARGKQRGRKQKKQAGGRARNERLSSVVKESVVEQVMLELRANAPFTCERNGETCHATLYLHTDMIGGLSKKTNKDEAKGSIVECINNGRLHIFANAKMIDAECMAIIPDKETIECCSEYALLRNIEYPICWISDDARNITVDNDEGSPTVSLEDCAQLFEESWCTNITDVLEGTSDGEVLDAGEATGDMTRPMGPVDDANSAIDAAVDAAISDLDEPEPAPQPAPVSEAEPEPQPEPQPQPEPMPEPQPAPDEVYVNAAHMRGDEAMRAGNASDIYGNERAASEPVREPDVRVSDAQWARDVQDSFASDEFGLRVDVSKFDEQFGRMVEFHGFSEVAGDGIIDSGLHDKCVLANSELRRMRHDHIESLRNKYVESVNSGIVKISETLSYDNTRGDAYWHKCREAIRRDTELTDAELAARVKEMATELDRSFDAAARAQAQSIAADVEREWKSAHTPEHRRELGRIATSLRNDLDCERADRMTVLNEQRVNEARMLMERLTSQIMCKLVDDWDEMMAEENAKFEQYRQDMIKFIDDNRKDDIVYGRALAEAQSRANEVEQLKAAQAAEAERMRAAYNADIAELNGKLEEAEHVRERALAQARENHRLDIERMESERDTLNTTCDKLRESIVHAGDDAQRAADERIEVYKTRIAELEAEHDQMERNNRRVSWATVAIAVVAVVAALCIGMVIGVSRGVDIMSVASSVMLAL